jgi:hypothetical protein
MEQWNSGMREVLTLSEYPRLCLESGLANFGKLKYFSKGHLGRGVHLSLNPLNPKLLKPF